jgi:hypothetical protein
VKALCLVLALLAGRVDAGCRQALALGLDVSGSVDATEYRLQADGTAAALQDPEIVAAFLAAPAHPVRLAVFEWSGPRAQVVVQGWVSVTDRSVLQAVADRLRRRSLQQADRRTALGQAKAFGIALLEEQKDCFRRTLDLSGDGKSNTGPHPRVIPANGVTVNALVVGQPEAPWQRSPGIGELSAYYNAHVIDGPDSFVETALGFADVESAMIRKLRREVQARAIGALRPYQRDNASSSAAVDATQDPAFPPLSFFQKGARDFR